MRSPPVPSADEFKYRGSPIPQWLPGAVLSMRLLPAFTLLLIIDFLARKAVSIVLPIASAGGTAGVIVNWAIFGLMVVALVLALRRRE